MHKHLQLKFLCAFCLHFNVSPCMQGFFLVYVRDDTCIYLKILKVVLSVPPMLYVKVIGKSNMKWGSVANNAEIHGYCTP